MKTLRERVKEHRLALGLNTSEYAKNVGTSRQNIENLEAGDVGQPRYINKLAKYMGLSVEDLLHGTEWDLDALIASSRKPPLPEVKDPLGQYGLDSLAGRIAVLGSVERAIAVAALAEWAKQGCPSDQVGKLAYLLGGASNDKIEDKPAGQAAA